MEGKRKEKGVGEGGEELVVYVEILQPSCSNRGCRLKRQCFAEEGWERSVKVETRR